jgi:hypothetical protein
MGERFKGSKGTPVSPLHPKTWRRSCRGMKNSGSAFAERKGTPELLGRKVSPGHAASEAIGGLTGPLARVLLLSRSRVCSLRSTPMSCAGQRGAPAFKVPQDHPEREGRKG